MLLAKARDIEQWASSREAQEQLPRLVRRLVSVTALGLEQLQFRAGEGIQLGGWDGLSSSRQSSPWVPEGVVGWELGTSRGVKRKADGDFDARSGTAEGHEVEQTTFVFVTPRRWANKSEWVKAKKSEAAWRDVRVYDADDLETWLESAPSVHVWFSSLIGVRPEGVVDLETLWNEWSQATSPAIPAELLAAGRGQYVGEVCAWLRQKEGVIAIRGDTRDDAVAFFAAAVTLLPEPEREQVLARVLAVETASAWRQVSSQQSGLLAISLLADHTPLLHGVMAGHQILLPLGRNEPANGHTISLPRIAIPDARTAIEALEVPGVRADELARVVHRSLGAFRRRLARHPAALTPRWAAPQAARGLVPALLAGRWRDENEHDQEVLANIAGQPYRQLRDELQRWANDCDAPVRLIGGVWTLVAPVDAWLLLRPSITMDDLHRFGAAVERVLGEVDPKLELPAADRWSAALRGKVLLHSPALRNGLCDILALMAGAFEAREGEPVDIARVSGAICERLFKTMVTADHWASLDEDLLLLAEACPDGFIDAVERGLVLDAPYLAELFADANPILFRSPHTCLLWALERLAWSPEHLMRTAAVLTRLASVDPGGQTGNRPLASLREIFLAWHPGSAATTTQRIKVLGQLEKRDPSIARKLLKELLPQHGFDSAHGTNKPRYRQWARDVVVTTRDAWEVYHHVATRLVADAEQDPVHWVELIPALERFPGDLLEHAIDALGRLEPRGFLPEQREAVWDAVRKLALRHTSFRKADWAYGAEVVAKLKQVRDRLAPTDTVTRLSWLFASDAARWLYAEDQDWRQQQERLVEMRVAALGQLRDETGVDGHVALARRTGEGWIIGFTLGKHLSGSLGEEHVGRGLLGDDEALYQLVLGYLSGRSIAQGPGWIDSVRLSKAAQEWNCRQIAAYYLVLPFNCETWDRLAREGQDVEVAYWTKVSVLGRGELGRTEQERVSAHLVSCGRVGTALNLLSMYSGNEKERVGPEAVASVLEAIVDGASLDDHSGGNLGYHTERLLEFIERPGALDATRVARIEFAFLPVLIDHSFPVLGRALAFDATFFADVLRWVYRGSDSEDEEVSETRRNRAQGGYRLLRNWKGVAGCENGQLDATLLQQWVAKVRELAGASGRTEVADSEIGQMLSRAPAGGDGLWPHEAVRELVENVRSEPLEQGIVRGIYNSRGMTTRSARDGGAQERELASGYDRNARALEDLWPRTARILKTIATRYDDEARHEDLRVELEDAIW